MYCGQSSHSQTRQSKKERIFRQETYNNGASFFFSAERSDWHIQSKNVVHLTGCGSRIGQSRKGYETITSLIPPPNRRTPTHLHTAASCNNADFRLAGTCAAAFRRTSERGIFLVPPASSVYHAMSDGSNARYRWHYFNNYACCSFGGARRSGMPRTV